MVAAINVKEWPLVPLEIVLLILIALDPPDPVVIVTSALPSAEEIALAKMVLVVVGV